jgi:hypothetical protein
MIHKKEAYQENESNLLHVLKIHHINQFHTLPRPMVRGTGHRLQRVSQVMTTTNHVTDKSHEKTSNIHKLLSTHYLVEPQWKK